MPNLPAVSVIQRSAQSFTQSALRIVGSLRSGSNLSAVELIDSMQVLNDLLDAWSAERIMTWVTPYTTLDQNNNVLSLVAGQQHYTLGNGFGNEDFLLPRPPNLTRVSVLYSASQATPVEVPLDMLDSVEWQAQANKTTTSILPQACYADPNPNGIDWDLYFWPVPTQANPIVLYPWMALTQFQTPQQQFLFPPAYARAIRFNLAIDLAAEFPCDLQKLPIVQKIAANAKSVIVGINSKVREAWADPALMGGNGARGNIYTGSPSRSHGF
jgi:hypothetical protein